MLKLLVVRHGQTHFNTERRFQGAIDTELNAIGLQQARAVARQLQDYEIDVIVSSPLERALQTAEIVADTISLGIHVMEQFAERNVGVYEGLTPEEAHEKYPEWWEQSSTRQLHMAPPGAENILELGCRVMDGLNQMRERYEGKTVLLVTHGYVGRMIYGILNRVSDEQFHKYRLENGEIAEYILT